MKRVLTITAAFVLVMAAATNASETRTTTMGDANNIVKDPGNIWLYPSTINMYPDQAEAVFNDFGSDLQNRVGVHYEFNASNPMVLGVYVINDGFASLSSYFSPPSRPLGVANTNRSFNVFWGKNWNGNPFGVHFRVHHNSFEDQTTTPTEEQSLTNLSATFGLTTSGGNVDWAAGFSYTTWNDKGSLVPVDPDGNYGVFLRVRKWNAVNSKMTWVWHGAVAYSKEGATRTDTSVSPNTITNDKMTSLGGDVGLGLNYTATSRALFILDFGLSYATLKTEQDIDGTPTIDQKDKVFTIPYWRVGMDGEVFSWLDLRFGATNSYNMASAEAASGIKVTEKGSHAQTFLGAGMHWGNNNQFEIDAWVDPEWVLNGPGFVSHNQNDSSNDDMFTEVTFTYFFRQ